MPRLLAFAASLVLSLTLAVPVAVTGTRPAYAASEFCQYNDARRTMPSHQMVFWSDVPRTKTALLFVVKYQGGYSGVAVSVTNCKFDTTANITNVKPYCLYLPADKKCHR